MSASTPGFIAIGLAASLGCVGCGAQSGASGDAGSSEVFVAQVVDFVGFCHWSHAPATPAGDAGASDGVHADAGPLTVYWNRPPPHAASQFPVGTIILKESQQANPAERTAFAMVKRSARGTAYNASGANGWEWWSVQDMGDCTIGNMPLWRGPVAQGTDSYVSSPAGDCNGCHGRAVGNDYVWDSALQLSNF
jgi:hypothetical protein